MDGQVWRQILARIATGSRFARPQTSRTIVETERTPRRFILCAGYPSITRRTGGILDDFAPQRRARRSQARSGCPNGKLEQTRSREVCPAGGIDSLSHFSFAGLCEFCGVCPRVYPRKNRLSTRIAVAFARYRCSLARE